MEAATEYVYREAGEGWAHSYLLPTLFQSLDRYRPSCVFEIGAGNGHVASLMSARGIRVQAIELSESGVEVARRGYPSLSIDVGSAYDDLAGKYGKFNAVVSLEVVEHLMFPRAFARAVADLLLPGGVAIVSTPYHGYFKNVALALSGKMDEHFTALWDGGHIKFWSIRTLTALMSEVGLDLVECHRVGRIPALAKSMVLVACKTPTNIVMS